MGILESVLIFLGAIAGIFVVLLIWGLLAEYSEEIYLFIWLLLCIGGVIGGAWLLFSEGGAMGAVGIFLILLCGFLVIMLIKALFGKRDPY